MQKSVSIVFHLDEQKYLNPIPVGVLKNQDMLGGVNLTPPPAYIKNATSLISFKNMYDKHISSM